MWLGGRTRGLLLCAVSVMSTADVRASEWNPTDGIDLVAGDYELAIDASLVSKKPKRSRGRLHLGVSDAQAWLRERDFRLYGWTDVDLEKAGVQIERRATPADSFDPENPGVIVWFPPPRFESFGRYFKLARDYVPVIMMIGTVVNKKTTRRSVDGGGIWLFIRSKEGRCLRGDWSYAGVAGERGGNVQVCPLHTGRPKR